METTRKCNVCSNDKPIDCFRVKVKNGKPFRYRTCRECNSLVDRGLLTKPLKQVETVRICNKCNVEKPIEMFRHRNQLIKGKYYSWYQWQCKKCFSLSTSLRKTEEKLGMAKGEYAAMLKAQGGVCAICKSSYSDKRGSRLSVDHDHLTGKVRGLLCFSCNSGAGQFKDSPQLLREAAAYLESRAESDIHGMSVNVCNPSGVLAENLVSPCST